MQALACLAIGGAVTTVCLWVRAILASEDLQQGADWRYDVSRVNELRRIDSIYRVFHPVIQVMAIFNRAAFRDALPEVQRQIQASGMPRFWVAEEYLAKIQLYALLTLPFFAYIFIAMFGAAGLLVAAMAVLALGGFLRLRLRSRARRRLQLIKRRIPFLLDLLTLLMEAGATFLNALRQAVQEFQNHPVSEEFGRVLIDMNLGKTRTEAFQAMRDRLADDEITSIIGSILQGELLGTPLGQIFRTQSDVLRLKRSQRAETVAGEAGVNMLLPAVVIMVSTVLIIIGPFFLNYLKFGLSM